MSFQLYHSTGDFLNGDKAAASSKTPQQKLPIYDVANGVTVPRPATTPKSSALPPPPQPKSKSVAHVPHDELLPLLNKDKFQSSVTVEKDHPTITDLPCFSASHETPTAEIPQIEGLWDLKDSEEAGKYYANLTNANMPVVTATKDSFNATHPAIDTLDPLGNSTREISVQNLASETKTIATGDTASFATVTKKALTPQETIDGFVKNLLEDFRSTGDGHKSAEKFSKNLREYQNGEYIFGKESEKALHVSGFVDPIKEMVGRSILNLMSENPPKSGKDAGKEVGLLKFVYRKALPSVSPKDKALVLFTQAQLNGKDSFDKLKVLAKETFGKVKNPLPEQKEFFASLNSLIDHPEVAKIFKRIR